MKLIDLVRTDDIEIREVAEHLNQLEHADRLVQTRELTPKMLAPLYVAAKGIRDLDVDFFVPTDLEPGKVVIHHGLNNMPVFRTFQKCMYRELDGTVGGRNVQTWDWLTGPGYFSVKPSNGANPRNDDEVYFDYVDLPKTAPETWPHIRSNARGLSFFVYRDLFDTMRAVSDHVSIGKAFRGSHELPQHFLLVRED